MPQGGHRSPFRYDGDLSPNRAVGRKVALGPRSGMTTIFRPIALLHHTIHSSVLRSYLVVSTRDYTALDGVFNFLASCA